MRTGSMHRGPLIRSTVVLITVVILVTGCVREDTSPRQPIAFSHKIHAGTLQMNCQYCHSGVRKSTAAYIPSVQTCMGCHKLAVATRPEIVKLRTAWENHQAIRWTRVNTVADFVYFNHYAHVSKGVPCSKCHGDIASMTEVKPFVVLNNMTFCVDCHRQNGASIDCYTCHR